MSRLGSPWQLIRLAIHAADSDVAARIAADAVRGRGRRRARRLERMIANLARQPEGRASARRSLACSRISTTRRARCAPRSISRGDSPWARQLAASRAEVAELLEGEIDNLPGPGAPPVAPARAARKSGRRARCRRCRRDRGRSSCSSPPAATMRASLRQRSDAARAFRVAELFRQRHAGSARPAAHLARRRAQLPPVAGRCGGAVLRQAVRRRICEPARQGRRRGRQGRAEGRKA